jgi:pyrroloquinoline quinone (PQQ) biosynthesis protein C
MQNRRVNRLLGLPTPELRQLRATVDGMAEADIAERQSAFAAKLDRDLTLLAQAQFETPEFRRVFATPLTIERARFFAIQFVHYNVNRRDCWGYIQARAPWDVKRVIWEHEKDELHFDPRGDADHRELMAKEALALGASAAEVANTTPTPLLQAAQMAFVHLAQNLPWLGALTASHFLERRNNSDLMEGGGFSARWRKRLVEELGVDPDCLISSNVHVAADVDHSDSIWAAIGTHVIDEETYNTALRGGEACAVVDRAYRAALAHGMEGI